MRTSRLVLGFSAALLACGLWQAFNTARALRVTTGSTAWMALFGAWIAALLAVLLLFLLSWRPAGPRIQARLRVFSRQTDSVRYAAAYPALLLALLPPALALAPLPDPLAGLMGTLAWRAVVFWFSALSGAACLKIRAPEKAFTRHLAAAGLGYALVFRAAAFLPDLSTYPFSLGWSEGSRYYYASLYLAEKVYGQAARPSVLHPTRYMMQAVPFLFGHLPVWVHRAWQVFLWLGTNGAAAWLFARRMHRLGPGGTGAGIALPAAWAFLFLFQAPVWYHLVIMLIILLWGVDTRRFWRTMLVVAATSIWAGMSRINWVPLPAAMAGLMYLLETPRRGRSPAGYLSLPAAWGAAGVGLGLLAQWAYALLSGNALDQFASSFTSDLLWYRLFPSATYPVGVLPGLLLAGLPVFLAGCRVLQGRWAAVDPLRLLGTGAVLGVFAAGGLVVSAKIGGGSNLHNMDAFIALLMVAGGYAVFRLEDGLRRAGGAVLALAIAVPVGFALAAGKAPARTDLYQAGAELNRLQQLVEASAAEGGEVLFIAERHLLAFDELDGVELVEDYEKVFLMEMAMAGNDAYLGRFAQDLADGRFALIVTDIVRYNPQTRADEFGEENNAWDRAVSYPLLCYYREVETLESAGVEILAPKAAPDCPEVPGTLDTTLPPQ